MAKDSTPEANVLQNINRLIGITAVTGVTCGAAGVSFADGRYIEGVLFTLASCIGAAGAITKRETLPSLVKELITTSDTSNLEDQRAPRLWLDPPNRYM